jgi:4-hydroxybenzoate polyprenyltransferase
MSIIPTLPMALCILGRPLLLPFVLCLPLVGFGWAHWDRALQVRGVTELILVLAAWTFLQAGTLWLNAALDRDQGEILLGRSIPVPNAAVPCGYAGLVVGVFVAFTANAISGSAAIACAALAVLYSHPATAWKGHPFLGPIVNWIGYGLLSPLGGWAAASVEPNIRSVIAWLLGSLGVIGCYFAAQSFQRNEDKIRGYRTLVVTHGPRGTILAARICIGAGFFGGTILAVIGWLPRLCLIALALWYWIDVWLRSWENQIDKGGERWARGLAMRLLFTSLLAIGLAYADYLLARDTGKPVAGLATAGGH